MALEVNLSSNPSMPLMVLGGGGKSTARGPQRLFVIMKPLMASPALLQGLVSGEQEDVCGKTSPGLQ